MRCKRVVYGILLRREYFPATNEKQIDYIKTLLDDVDYVILIIGNCYGSIDLEGVSYTKREFEYAIKNNIPVLAFLNEKFKPEIKIN
ncbi:MAG: DUF4062 domain-containing protein [Butyrivibrio sp.]|nr:DUF4062 domain-containing protein [Butyrivibrio sp.]